MRGRMDDAEVLNELAAMELNLGLRNEGQIGQFRKLEMQEHVCSLSTDHVAMPSALKEEELLEFLSGPLQRVPGRHVKEKGMVLIQ